MYCLFCSGVGNEGDRCNHQCTGFERTGGNRPPCCAPNTRRIFSCSDHCLYCCKPLVKSVGRLLFGTCCDRMTGLALHQVLTTDSTSDTRTSSLKHSRPWLASATSSRYASRPLHTLGAISSTDRCVLLPNPDENRLAPTHIACSSKSTHQERSPALLPMQPPLQSVSTLNAVFSRLARTVHWGTSPTWSFAVLA